MQRPTLSRSTQELKEAPRLRLCRGDALALVIGLPSIVAIALLPDSLPIAVKIALSMVVLTVISWTFTKLNTTLVALFAASILLLSTTISIQTFFTSLSKSSVWLLLGACLLAGALQQTGLISRLTICAVRAARSVQMLFYLLTAVLLLAALIIPSSAARAALLLPIYQVLAATLHDAKITRALALMLPINIMLTAIASLVGAGAHLVISDALGQLTGQTLSFGVWVLMGAPFAALSAFGSTALILHLFLDPAQRHRPLSRQSIAKLPQSGSFTQRDLYTIWVTATVFLLGATEWLHGVPAMLVLLFGTLALLAPRFSVAAMRDTIRNVSWELFLFVAATLTISTALVESGAEQVLLSLAPHSALLPLSVRLAILSVVAALALMAHIFIASRAVRGAVLAPLTVLLAYSLGFDPLTIALVTAAGIGYCLTLVGKTNPLAQFQQYSSDGRPPFTTADLTRLNNRLAPMHFGLILAFGMLYWPLFGWNQKIPQVQVEENLRLSPITTPESGSIGNEPVTPNGIVQEICISASSEAPAGAPICTYPTPAAAGQIYTLAITANNGGIVTDPPGNSHPAGQEVQLAAFPEQGYYFVGWAINERDWSDTNPVLIRIDNDTYVVAYFAPLPPNTTAAPTNPLTEPGQPTFGPGQPTVGAQPPTTRPGQPTAVPPTARPGQPTAVPPTARPGQPTTELGQPTTELGQPTAVLPTTRPGQPTAVPPTAVPPTAVPPTAVPPTAVPPTAVPPTAVPPTAVPPTAVPPPTATSAPAATPAPPRDPDPTDQPDPPPSGGGNPPRDPDPTDRPDLTGRPDPID